VIKQILRRMKQTTSTTNFERVEHILNTIQMSTTSSSRRRRKKRVGIVGFGKVGQFLVRTIREDSKISGEIEIAFVWNRTQSRMEGHIHKELQLQRLEDAMERNPDLIVEVADPKISETFGADWLRRCDYMIGSPSGLASKGMEKMINAASAHSHGLYIPSGALWGAEDIQKMADRNTLGSLSISMAFHPSSLKRTFGELTERMKKHVKPDGTTDGPVTLYSGPVRDLCPMAPNNVNTMAAAALAAHTLGFDKVHGELIVDSSLDAHVITVDAKGRPRPDGSCFRAVSTRHNPAQHGAVTGSATLVSFVSSMMRAEGRGRGVHFC
jgi:aspartate dehydrogenase